MQYIQVSFQFSTIEEYQKDLLIDELGGIGYTTFEDVTGGFAAFIDLDSYSEEQLEAITAELFAQPDIDGGLIGGASLKSRDFLDIIKTFNS